jgi:YVTN family beta-propeller protein
LSLDTSSLLRGIAFSLPPSEGFFLSGMAVDQAAIVFQSMSQIYVGYDVAVDPNVIVITGSGHSLIPVSVPPGPITVNETTSKIYVAGSSGIIVIDAASNSVIDSISDSSGTAPSAIAVNPTTNTIYVARSQSNNVRVIDGGTDSVTGTIQVGTAPSGVAVDPQTNFIYVANAGSSQTGDAGSITVINGVTNATQTLTDLTAKNPAAVAVNPTTNKIYVANTGSNNVTVINGAHN